MTGSGDVVVVVECLVDISFVCVCVFDWMFACMSVCFHVYLLNHLRKDQRKGR